MSNTPYNKVCIYGAGAIGAWIGTRLASVGCTVSVVARGSTLQALQQHGLRCQFEKETLATPVLASEDPTALGVQDLVILSVKAPGLAEVARRIRPLLGPQTVVLNAMNGVPWWFFQGFGEAYAGTQLKAIDPKGEIAANIPGTQVIGGVVHSSCTLLEPGYARNLQGNRIIVGEPSGQKTERVQQLAALLTQAGFETELSAQIQKDIWYKLWGNMTINPVSALTGATTDKILGDKLVRDFISKIMLEAKEIGARIGIPIFQQPEDRHAVSEKLGAFKTSMLQDVEAGRPVEIDALVTVVRELGTLTGVPTPNMDILLGLARLQARVRKLY